MPNDPAARDMQQSDPPPSRPIQEPTFLQRLKKGGIWTTIDAWTTEAAGALVFLALARLLDPAEFGIVTMAAIFVTLASDLGAFSISQVLIQRKELERGHINAVFVTILVLSMLLTAVVVATAPLIAALYGEPGVLELLLWLSPAILLNAMTAVPISLLTREMHFAQLAIRSFLMVVVGGAVGIVMAVNGYGPWALVGQTLTQSAVSVVCLLYAADWRPGFAFERRHFTDIASFMVNTLGIRGIQALDQRVGQFILGWALGSTAVGYFRIATRLVEILVRLFIVPISQLTMPGFAKVQSDPVRVRKLLEGGVALTSLVAYPAFLGAAAVSPDLMSVVVGDQWLPAVPVLAILALRGITSTVTLPGTSLLYALGRPDMLLKVGFVNLLFNVFVFAAFAHLGVVVAASVEVLRLFVCHWPLIGIGISRLTGVTLLQQVRLVLPSLAASLAMAAAVLAWREGAEGLTPIMGLLSGITVGVLVYAAASLVLNRGLLRQAVGLAGLRRPARV